MEFRDLESPKVNLEFMSRVIEGHRGIIYQVEFSTDDDKVISSSDDGRVIIWDWKSGKRWVHGKQPC